MHRRLAALIAPLALALVPSSASATPPGCTVEATTGAEITNAIVAADAGETVCVAAGAYGAVLLGGDHASWAYVKPSPGATVTFASLEFSWSSRYIDVQGFKVAGQTVFTGENWQGVKSSRLRVHGMEFTGQVLVNAGQDHLVLERNWWHDTPGTALALSSVNQTVPYAPVQGTVVESPITNTTVRNNKFEDPGVDAILASNFDHLDITENEFTGVAENSNDHSDVFQSVWGGSDLWFDRNYVHDNSGQGFFVKDGLVTDAVVNDNLFVRNTGSGQPIHIVTGQDFFMKNNVTWGNDQGSSITDPSSDFDITENVFEYLNLVEDEPDGDASDYWYDPVAGEQREDMVWEDFNVLGGGWAWSGSGRAGAHDLLNLAGLEWVDPTHQGDDFRLDEDVTVGGETYAPGINWAPGDFPMGL
jgi:hypothetical protein